MRARENVRHCGPFSESIIRSPGEYDKELIRSSYFHNNVPRYVFDLFYKRKAISRELYDFCIKEKIADGNLIAKWKKQGYENLCCLRCIQTRDTNFATNCICRVPKSKLEEGRIVECIHCGCRGCSG